MASVFKTSEGQGIVHERYRDILRHWPVEHRQRRIPTRQGETFVIESGPEDAPALVLLHGTAANAASWIVDIPTWSQHLRVFCVDIIGDAGFSAQVRPPYDSDAHMEWFDDVMEGLSLSTTALVGMSLGGWLALTMPRAGQSAWASSCCSAPAVLAKPRIFCSGRFHCCCSVLGDGARCSNASAGERPHNYRRLLPQLLNSPQRFSPTSGRAGRRFRSSAMKPCNG